MRLIDDPNRGRRLELVLAQLDSLPTLPAVAVRLLQVTSDEESDAQQVIEVVRSDPALSAKVLALCRGVEKRARSPITTVDKAVVMLGFEQIRSAVLAIKVFETFAGDDAEDGPGAEADRPATPFSRAAFWNHCLAVAIASELICKKHTTDGSLNASDAFVCGLLHDIGKLALEHVLPRAYARVVELTEQMQCNIAQVERRIIGVDHHTVGKRLAEQWQLPHIIQDTIWLHGTPYAMLPDLPHRPTIGVVGVADLLVRQAHIGYSGDLSIGESLDDRANEAGLDPVRVRGVMDELHTELRYRVEVMGLGKSPTRSLLLESLTRANGALGRLNSQLAARRKEAVGHGRALASIAAFHRSVTEPGRNVHDVFAAVVRSATEVMGPGYFGMLFQSAAGQPWLLTQHHSDGRVVRSQYIDPPPRTPDVASLAYDDPLAMPLTAIWPWISDYLLAASDVRKVRLLPLPCGWGTAAVLLHDRDELPRGSELDALSSTWGGSIATVAQHQGARRLGEQLVEANRQLADMQESMLASESLARLGEMAAGAAHEMNNPLAVISGRAQILASSLPLDSRERQAAEQIAYQVDRLSDMITALRLFADPPLPRYADVQLADVLERAVHLLRQRRPEAQAMKVTGVDNAPPLRTDAEQLSACLAELLVNAHEAEPRSPVVVAATVDATGGRLVVQVIDDGVGMSAGVLNHAFDPFYSAKPAGRQPGLGLARVRRIAQVLGGDITLRSTSGEGTTAMLIVPLSEPRGGATAKGQIDEPSQSTLIANEGGPGAFPFPTASR